MHCVETPRLVLRPFQRHGDGEGLFSVVGNDPDMTWDHSTRQLEMVTRTAADRAKHFDDHDFGVWAVIEKESASMIGQCGLQCLPESEKIEIVVYTAKRFWRSGYAYGSGARFGSAAPRCSVPGSRQPVHPLHR